MDKCENVKPPSFSESSRLTEGAPAQLLKENRLPLSGGSVKISPKTDALQGHPYSPHSLFPFHCLHVNNQVQPAQAGKQFLFQKKVEDLVIMKGNTFKSGS